MVAAASCPQKMTMMMAKRRAALVKSTARWRQRFKCASHDQARLKREPGVWDLFDPRHDELWARWEKTSAEVRMAKNMCTLEDHCLAELALPAQPKPECSVKAPPAAWD
jgi:hypothetical protein